MNARKIWLFIRLSRPHFILGAALLYALGAGIVRYLGTPIDWGLYFLGLVWVTFIQLSTHYLNEYFDSPVDVENEHRTPFSGGSGTIGKEKLSRETALYAGVICLALAAYFTLVIIRSAQVNAALVITLVLIFLGAFLLFHSASSPVFNRIWRIGHLNHCLKPGASPGFFAAKQ
jgi:1,4-dihydroxy-2-naphthoate octaprenyltransferase